MALAAILFSCTDNIRTKTYGGTSTIDLPSNEKLINVSWKESDLWYLTRPMTASDVPETYKYQEKSSFGVWQGTFIIKEHKIEAIEERQ